MFQLTPVQSSELSNMKGIEHAFFTRKGGVSNGIYAGLNAGLGSGDDRAHVVENRNRMANFLNVAHDKIASPYQVHSPDAIVTSHAWQDNRPQADGVVTNTPGLALGIVTADCGPVLFADADAGVIGACHAGWKGAVGGVMENTIAQMETLGAKRKNTVAILGPCISQENYEVGPDFPNPFLQLDAENARYFVPSKKTDHHMFDLTGYIVDRLAKTGVQSGTVARCTYAEEDNFYSYRRTTHRNEPDYGRQLSAIVLQA
jgi:YfiH family protein